MSNIKILTSKVNATVQNGINTKLPIPNFGDGGVLTNISKNVVISTFISTFSVHF